MNESVDEAIRESILRATVDEGESTEVGELILAWFSELAKGADPEQVNAERIEHVLEAIENPDHKKDEAK
jgi:hypothetical protein